MPGGKPLIIILFAVFVDVVGFGIIVPILPFLTIMYGGDAVVGAMLMGIYSLMTFIGGPIWGRLSDKIGRRPTLIATFTGSIVAYLIFAYSNSLAMLFLARGVAGLMAGNVGIVMAATADLTSAQDRGRALGLIGAAFGLGFAIGPGIGALLSGEPGSPSVLMPGLVAACASLTALILTVLWFPETRTRETEDEKTEKIPARVAYKSIILPVGNLFLMLIVIVASIAQSSAFFISPWWAQATLGWTQYEVGYMLMTVGMVVAAVQSLAVGPLFRRFGEAKSLAFGNISQMAGCGLLMLEPGAYQAFVALPLIFGGLTLTFPAMNSLISQRTPHHLQGTALGLSTGVSSLGRLIGPLIIGSLFELYSPIIPFVVVGAIGIIIITWAVWDMRRFPHNN